jgi:hypothetical protein
MSDPNAPNDLKTSIGTSVVRTVTPVVAGAILTGALELGVDLPDGVISTAVATVVTTVYYAGARFLEERVGPAWGWLLGYARAPKYTPPAT